MGNRKQYNYADPRLPEFTKRFKKIVDDAGGVSKIAEITGISRPTINFWYNGQRTPDAENLVTLSKTLNVSSDFLLGLIPKGNFTNNAKLRAASEYTGLGNNAIDALEAINDKEVLNAVLLSPHFADIVEIISDSARFAGKQGKLIIEYMRAIIANKAQDLTNALRPYIGKNLDNIFKNNSIEATIRLFDTVSEELYKTIGNQKCSN